MRSPQYRENKFYQSLGVYIRQLKTETIPALVNCPPVIQLGSYNVQFVLFESLTDVLVKDAKKAIAIFTENSIIVYPNVGFFWWMRHR